MSSSIPGFYPVETSLQSSDNRNISRHYQTSSEIQWRQNCPWLRTIALKIVMFRGRCINRVNNQCCFLDSGQWGWWQGISVGGWKQMYLMKPIPKPDKKTSMGNSFLGLFHPPFPLYPSSPHPSPVDGSEIRKTLRIRSGTWKTPACGGSAPSCSASGSRDWKALWWLCEQNFGKAFEGHPRSWLLITSEEVHWDFCKKITF